MSERSNNPPEPTPPNTKNSIMWAAVIGVGTAGLIFWVLSSQSFVARLVAGFVAGVAVGVSSYRKSVAESVRTRKESDN